MALLLVQVWFDLGVFSQSMTNDLAREVGRNISFTIVVAMLHHVWFTVLVSALALGLFLKSSVVERGPTGGSIKSLEINALQLS